MPYLLVNSRSLATYIFLFVAAITPTSAEWTPPANPSPMRILDDAEQNINTGAYAEALSQLEWLFEHSLEVRPEFLGVRASVVLRDWHQLGKVYPPALQSLKAERDSARQKVLRISRLEVMNSEDFDSAFDSFHDVININRTLSAEANSVELFREISQEAPEMARSVYPLAQAALIKAKEFELCGRFLNPLEAYAGAVRLYGYHVEKAEDTDSAAIRSAMIQMAEEGLVESTAELIALLTINDREGEAQILAEHLKKKLDHLGEIAELDAALQGRFPNGRE